MEINYKNELFEIAGKMEMIVDFTEIIENPAKELKDENEDKDENEKPTWPGMNSLASAGKFHPLRMGEFHTLMQGNPPQELMQKDSEMTPKKTLPSNTKTFTFESYERKTSFFEAWGDFLQKKLGNSTLPKDI